MEAESSNNANKNDHVKSCCNMTMHTHIPVTEPEGH